MAKPEAVNWKNFRTWVFSRYAKTYAPTVYCYAKRYAGMLAGNMRQLDTFTDSKRNAVLKALISLSKYLGVYKDFKARLDDHGVKFARTSSFDAFVRILTAKPDVLDWYRKANSTVRPNERLFLKLALTSGLRKGEAVNAFNLLTGLAEKGRVDGYYNHELSALEHFKFKGLFLRGKKNVYVTFIPKATVMRIAESKPVSYSAIRKRLKRRGLRCRINELRDYYATFMRKHGLIREEVDLLQGRIPANMFIRYYWSPSFKDLSDRTLRAARLLEKLYQIELKADKPFNQRKIYTARLQ